MGPGRLLVLIPFLPCIFYFFKQQTPELHLRARGWTGRTLLGDGSFLPLFFMFAWGCHDELNGCMEMARVTA